LFSQVFVPMTDRANDCDSDLLSDSGDDEEQRNREHLLSLNPFSLRNFSKAKAWYMAEFDVEKWVFQLKDVTAPTAISRISWEEGLALQHCYQEACCCHKGKITDEDKTAIESLLDKIRRLMHELGAHCENNRGFFVRLGPRSPKDAPMHLNDPPAFLTERWNLSKEKIGAAVKLAVSDLDFTESSVACNANAHALLQRFQTASYSLLRSTSEYDAISLLICSSRVMQDVSRTRDHGEHTWNMSLVVRAWDDNFRLDREFRTFVVGGEITAIAQYDDQLCYSFVKDYPESIVKAIVRSLDSIRPNLDSLGLTSASMAVVVDFLVVPGDAVAGGDTSTWSAQVVELNPFGPATGAPLFNWHTDRRVLQGGRDLYGDLEECERQHPAGSEPLPKFAAEEVIDGIPFRYIASNPPNFTWDHLSAFWADYLGLAFPALGCMRR